ncbi:MAG: transcription termination/antitermination protein NusG [Pirellulales bacterium]
MVGHEESRELNEQDAAEQTAPQPVAEQSRQAEQDAEANGPQGQPSESSPDEAADAARSESPTPPPKEDEDSFVVDEDDDYTPPAEEEEPEHAEFTDDDLGDDAPFVPHTQMPVVESNSDDVEDVAPLELEAEEYVPPTDAEMDWYILKVQSNRESSVASALERRVKLAGLENYFDQILVPVEKITEFKGGKKKIVKRKKYPGYIVVRMALNDDSWFVVRETAGIGDFTGSAGRPSPMLPNEVSQIVEKPEVEGTEEQPRLSIPFKLGDRVKINEGTFENFEGDVETIDTTNGRVIVMINIFNRTTPVELEYWQIENV